MPVVVGNEKVTVKCTVEYSLDELRCWVEMLSWVDCCWIVKEKDVIKGVTWQ